MNLIKYNESTQRVFRLNYGTLNKLVGSPNIEGSVQILTELIKLNREFVTLGSECKYNYVTEDAGLREPRAYIKLPFELLRILIKLPIKQFKKLFNHSFVHIARNFQYCTEEWTLDKIIQLGEEDTSHVLTECNIFHYADNDWRWNFIKNLEHQEYLTVNKLYGISEHLPYLNILYFSFKGIPYTPENSKEFYEYIMVTEIYLHDGKLRNFQEDLGVILKQFCPNFDTSVLEVGTPEEQKKRSYHKVRRSKILKELITKMQPDLAAILYRGSDLTEDEWNYIKSFKNSLLDIWESSSIDKDAIGYYRNIDIFNRNYKVRLNLVEKSNVF